MSANDVRDLGVDKMGDMQGLPRAEQSLLERRCRRSAPQHIEQGGGVDDDHGNGPRMVRIASAANSPVSTLDRRAKRSRISSIVGRSATALISLRR